jgi:Uma2 family endonuclease
MTADEFLAWDARQPRERGRFELIDGHVVTAQSERARHVDTKFQALLALRDAIKRARLPCSAHGDGLSVRISARKVYKPDVMVRCGTKTDPEAVFIADPIILVEVLSEDCAGRDHGEKLVGYFSLPGVEHYLIVDPVRRVVIHHRRAAGEDLLTRVRKTGPLALDPPGLEIDLADLFGREDEQESE